MVKSNFEIINELKQSNLFYLMISNGLVSTSFEAYHNIYTYYLDLCKVGGLKADIIHKVSQKHNISERSVYVIINKMR